MRPAFLSLIFYFFSCNFLCLFFPIIFFLFLCPFNYYPIPPPNAYSRTHALNHSRTHSHIRTHARTNERTHARTHAHTHAHKHAHTLIHTHTHTHPRPHKRVHLHIRVRATQLFFFFLHFTLLLPVAFNVVVKHGVSLQGGSGASSYFG